MAEIVEIPVVWLQGGACTGCAVSLLNSVVPGAGNVVLRELTPGRHLSLRFLATVMAGQGKQVVDILHDEAVENSGGYVLVVEGTVHLGHDMFATLGEVDGREVPIHEHAAKLAKNAMAVVAMGTCASFGGIPAAEGNPTGAASIATLLEREGIDVPLVNIPGCPPHPDWLVGTLVTVCMLGLEATAATLDDLLRPTAYYGKSIHETCPRRADFDAGRFARNFGEPGCLYELGCKGPMAYADCPTRKWNGGANWCVGDGAPCNACVEPTFPDMVSPLYEKITAERMARFQLLDPHAPSATKD